MDEVDHGRQGGGGTEAPRPGDQGVDLGVQRLGPAVRGAAAEGVMDGVLVAGQGPGEPGELGGAAPVRPGGHAAHQRLALVALDLERLADLLLEQVPLVQRLVRDGDLGQSAPLAGRQLVLVLAQCPHAAAEGGGLVAAPGGAQLPGDPAAQLVQPLICPLDDVERVQADLRLRCLLAHDRVDPVRPVGGHVGQQPRPLLTEGAEERLHGGLAASLADPGDPPGVVIGDDDQVLAAALIQTRKHM